jgi:hypothetical protein
MKIRTSYSPLALFTCQRDDAADVASVVAAALAAVGRLNGSLEQIERVGFRAARLR